MARTRRSSPSELQKRQLATILSRKGQPSAPSQAPRESTNDNGAEKTKIDFESALPQSQGALFSKLPTEVRLRIYQELWASAGPMQHIVTDEACNGRYYHYGCVGKRAAPSESEIGEKTEATQLENRSRWEKDCYHCCIRFDFSVEDPERNPLPPVEKSPFLPMLLTCKRIHLEAVESISRNVCFSFPSYSAAYFFICEQRPKIVDHIRHVHIAASVSGDEWIHEHEWRRLISVFYQLPKLQRVTLFLDVERIEWPDDIPRQQILNPRLCFWLVWLPPHIQVDFWMPCESLEEAKGSGMENGGILDFMRMSGGLVEEATLDMILGPDYPKVRPKVFHYPRLEVPE